MLRSGRTIVVILLSLPGLFLLLPNLQAALGGSGQAPRPIAEAGAQRVSPIVERRGRADGGGGRRLECGASAECGGGARG